MNMPTKDKIGWAIVVLVLVAVNLFLGISYPLPAEPTAAPSVELVGERSAGANVRTEKALVVQNYIDNNGTLDVAGATTLGGVLAADGGLTVDTSNFTVNGSTGAVAAASTLYAAGDVTAAADSTGGNLGAKTEFIGLPKIKLIGGAQGTNPGSQTISLVDDTPDGEFAPVDASVTEALSTTIVKYGTNSYGATFAADAAAGDGFLDAGLGASAAWDDMESAGLLVYSTATWAEGDLTLVLTDDGGARTFDIPALTTANKWTWLEVNIATGDLSAVSDVAIKLSAAGATALGAFTMYLDIGYVWDSVDEEALGQPILQDGVLSAINTETGATLVELTDYIVHYENGNDFIVYITDQSAADIAVLVAVQQIG